MVIFYPAFFDDVHVPAIFLRDSKKIQLDAPTS